MAVHRAALVMFVVIVCSICFDMTSIKSVSAAAGYTQRSTSMSLYEQKNHVLSSLRSAGYHRVAAVLELSNILRALPQNATLFAPSDEAIATIVFSPTFSTLLLYHFAAHRFSFADLLVLPHGSRIGTFLPGRSLLVTSGSGATKVSIDGVAVVVPDIYQDGTLCVHGLTALLDPDRFGIAEDLSPVLTAPARNMSVVRAPPARHPEPSDPAEVGSQPASSSAPSVTGPVTRPSPAGSHQQVTLPPVVSEVRSRSMLAPAAAIYMDQGPGGGVISHGTVAPATATSGTPSIDNLQEGASRGLASSPRYHVGAPFAPASSNHLDSGHGGQSSHRGRRSSFQLKGARGPVASDYSTYNQDLASRGQRPASGPGAAPRRAHGPSQHYRYRSRLSSNTPSNSPVSSSRISASPSPDHYRRSSTYGGTGPSPDNVGREDSSQRDFAGASPSSAPSPHSRTLSSPHSPSTRISAPSPHTYVVANLAASDQASNSPHGPENAADRTWVSPSSPPTPAHGPAGRIPTPLSSPAAYNFNVTSTSPGFGNAADSMRPATPFLPSLSPVTPPNRAPATGRPPLSSSPPARIGSPRAPSNAELPETSPPSVHNVRDPIA